MPWNSLLAIGVPEIDKQHMTWYERADQLFEAGRNHKSAEFMGEMLDFLDDYTKKHFSDEEAYMLSVNYPGYADQKRQHAAFLESLKKLKADYAGSGGNILVVLNANQLVIDWLTKHISTADRKLGDYVKSMGK
ncbi:MAG: bacteriohemerythrin [Eubacteriales bacterium]|nr:bacteriohemerythrin [Eubacteriales bacterium]